MSRTNLLRWGRLTALLACMNAGCLRQPTAPDEGRQPLTFESANAAKVSLFTEDTKRYKLAYFENYPGEAMTLVFDPINRTREKVQVYEYFASTRLLDPESKPPHQAVEVEIVSMYVLFEDGPGQPADTRITRRIRTSDKMQHVWVTYPEGFRINISKPKST